jgi:hypothetical protein
MTTIAMSANAQYGRTLPDVEMVRDCIEGEPKIKHETTKYLTHPDMIDKTSPQAIARYAAYIQGAEFDEYPSDTERSILGAMTTGQPTIDLPDKLAYLEENADGDGMPLAGLQEILYKNLLEVKYHILVAEMASLKSAGAEIGKRLSQADYERLKLKASIKSYTRESLVDWEFERINGVMQLSLLVFEESCCVRDKDTLATKTVKGRLVLGLDANGKYYQKKLILGDDKKYSQKELFYPKVGGRELKWIPAEIVIDEEVQAGCIPAATGYLRSVCAASLNRYRVSADEKEAMRHMQPTTFTRGWSQGDLELFKELNGGREYIAFGAGVSNNLPREVEVDIKGLGAETEPFEKYYERSDKKLASFGANVGGDSQQAKTATQAASEASKRVAVMNSIANNSERAIKRMVSYCGMFMGLWKPEAVEDALKTFDIKFPREFATLKLTPEDAGAIANLVLTGIYPKSEGVKMLVEGGFSVSTAEQIMNELEQQAPMPNAGSPITDNSQDSQE